MPSSADALSPLHTSQSHAFPLHHGTFQGLPNYFLSSTQPRIIALPWCFPRTERTKPNSKWFYKLFSHPPCLILHAICLKSISGSHSQWEITSCCHGFLNKFSGFSHHSFLKIEWNRIDWKLQECITQSKGIILTFYHYVWADMDKVTM